jgi:hypothetical protein
LRNRTKMFHVKHFGTIDAVLCSKLTFAKREHNKNIQATKICHIYMGSRLFTAHLN